MGYICKSQKGAIWLFAGQNGSLAMLAQPLPIPSVNFKFN
jgi:hypothetical protein